MVNIIQAECSQCHRKDVISSLETAQTEGWMRVDYRPMGSAAEHSDAKTGDLCPICFAALKKTMATIEPGSNG